MAPPQNPGPFVQFLINLNELSRNASEILVKLDEFTEKIVKCLVFAAVLAAKVGI